MSQLLPLKSYDIILGADWMKRYGPISLDLSLRTLEITRDSKRITFQDYTRPSKSGKCLTMQLDKMLHKGVLGFILYCQDTTPTPFDLSDQSDKEIRELLAVYSNVFSDITTLPPHRQCDMRFL